MRIGSLLAVAPLLLVACDSGQQEAVPAPPASRTVWHGLGTWSGSGDRQTESFDVTTGALRLAWQTQGESTREQGRLRVALHSSISGRPLETIVDAHGAGAGTAYVAADPRVAYLLIESEALDWRVTLEEGVTIASDGTPDRLPQQP